MKKPLMTLLMFIGYIDLQASRARPQSRCDSVMLDDIRTEYSSRNGETDSGRTDKTDSTSYMDLEKVSTFSKSIEFSSIAHSSNLSNRALSFTPIQLPVITTIQQQSKDELTSQIARSISGASIELILRTCVEIYKPKTKEYNQPRKFNKTEEGPIYLKQSVLEQAAYPLILHPYADGLIKYRAEILAEKRKAL